jgi:hypothetical protein
VFSSPGRLPNGGEVWKGDGGVGCPGNLVCSSPGRLPKGDGGVGCPKKSVFKLNFSNFNRIAIFLGCLLWWTCKF